MTTLVHAQPGGVITAAAWNSLIDQSIPVGAILEWPTSAPPSGWALCDGGSTSGQADLAAVVGPNRPDRRALVPTLLGTVASKATTSARAPITRTSGVAAIELPTLQITKVGPTSELMVSWNVSGWIGVDPNPTPPGNESLGLTTSKVKLVQGALTRTTREQQYYWNRREDHRQFGLTDKLSGVEAGSWSVTVEVNGAGLGNDRNQRFIRDVNDEASVSVYELLPRYFIIKC